METLGIEPCENGLRLTIYNNDNTQTEISWHCCLDGPKSNKTLLNNALRTCIDPQIWDYRCRHFPSLCQFCDEEATDLDYVYEFHKIRDKFLNTYQGRIPEHFTKKAKNIQNRLFTKRAHRCTVSRISPESGNLSASMP
jgi:hypothetical protein